MNMTRLIVSILVVFAGLCARAAEPDAWPVKPIRIIMPGASGGVADVRTRWLAARLTASLGQPVIVENRPGAGGNIGTEIGAKSAGDGYTLVTIHQGTMAVNPHLYASLPYDPLRDLIPITRLGYGPLMLAVNPSLPVRSVEDLVRLARTRRLSYGTPGVGTPPHLAVELFLRNQRIEATHVPYKGGGQSVSDLVGGTLDFTIEGLTIVYPQVKAGRLRALAITGEERSAACPEVPTMREAGVPGYSFYGWVGIAVPASTPPAMVARVHEAVAREMRTPAAKEWFATFAANPDPDTPQDLARIVREEYERLGEVVRGAGIKPE